MPRFWYLPRGEKAAVIMTGDDHGYGAMVPYFDRMKSMSPAGCSVAELGVHPRSIVRLQRHAGHRRADEGLPGRRLRARPAPRTPRCDDYTPQLYDQLLSSQLATFKSTWPSISDPPVQPHALRRSGAAGPRSRRASGRRASASTRTTTTRARRAGLKKPGLMIGSGFPQRFADLDGSMIDVYQSMTQVTDERARSTTRSSCTRCSTARSATRATTAPSTCSPTATTATTTTPTRWSPRPSAAACRSSAPSRCSTGPTAATARPSPTSPTAAGS